MRGPNGKKDSAAFIMPKSPYVPMYFQAGCPFVSTEVNAPIDTNATRQYNTTTRIREMKIALGIFLFGFFTSSPVWTIISYPSKAINVNPIAATIPPIPKGA
jgi:hypothetical protein